MQIIVDIAQVQAVATQLNMSVADADALFGQLCANGTTKAVRDYVQSRMGPTFEDIETNAIPGHPISPQHLQVILAAGVAGGWFRIYDINPTPQ